MTGFRQTFNLSYSEEDNATGATCSEGVAESTILVHTQQGWCERCEVCAYSAGVDSVHLFSWLSRGGTLCRR